MTTVELLDEAITATFRCERTADLETVAREVLGMAGRREWVQDFAPGATTYLVKVAEEIAAVRTGEDRRVDVPKRIEQVVRYLSEWIPRLCAPGILLALNPKARIDKAD